MSLRLRQVVLIGALAACGDPDWEAHVAERAGYLCRFQEVCAESTDGLDCSAYVQQFEPRPNPCLRIVPELVDACFDELDAGLADLRADPSTCPADASSLAPSCAQAFVESQGGACIPASP